MSEKTTYQQPNLLPGDFPANPTASPENVKPPTTTEICGRSSPELFAKLSLNGCWLKMSQGYCLAKMDGSLVKFSQTWPQAGMVSNGKAYRLRRLVRRISGRGSLLLPTMRASERGQYQYSQGDHSKKVLTLTGYVKMFPIGLRDFDKLYPTPTVNDSNNSTMPDSPANRASLVGRVMREIFATPTQSDSIGTSWGGMTSSLRTQVGGQLNPRWVEWLMGFPDGWTDLEDLETQ